ncbi:hypothetical protein AAKU67_000670 [Oxalobacteraceae bacterium GrIS 2.11]
MKKIFVLLCAVLTGLGASANESDAPGPAQHIYDSVIMPHSFSPTILLPDLAEPASPDTMLRPTPNGILQLKGSLGGDQFLIKQDFHSAKGAPLDVDFVTQKIADTTIGWLISSTPAKNEKVVNLGWRLGGNQQLLFSAAQLRGMISDDLEGKSPFNLNQNTGGLDYRYFVDQKWLTDIELSGYASESASQTAADAQQHIAGSNLVGLRFGLEASPLSDTKIKVRIGSERLSYDSLTGTPALQNVNTSISWSQIILPTVKYSASVEGKGAERNLSTGLDVNLRNGQQVGFKLAHMQSSDGLVSDNALQFSYTLQFGNKFKPFQPKADNAPWNSSLVPEVLQRPGYLPKSVLSKPDSSLN